MRKKILQMTDDSKHHDHVIIILKANVYQTLMIHETIF